MYDTTLFDVRAREIGCGSTGKSEIHKEMFSCGSYFFCCTASTLFPYSSLFFVVDEAEWVVFEVVCGAYDTCGQDVELRFATEAKTSCP